MAARAGARSSPAITRAPSRRACGGRRGSVGGGPLASRARRAARVLPPAHRHGLRHPLARRRRRIAVLTVNRPEKLNALNAATIADLGAAIDELRGRDDVAGVILTGAGRAFVAGADISEIAGRTPLEAEDARARRPGGVPPRPRRARSRSWPR
jgi:hypothetical protein